MLKEYLKNIKETTNQGDAREESYYPVLEKLFESYAITTKKKKTHITTLPKKTEAGNPDFRIWDGSHHIIGYIEAKTPDTNLDLIENSEQLKRYRKTFPNLILTNFYEFRLYRNGERIETVMLGRPFIALKLKTTPVVENEEKFLTLIWKFFDFLLPKVFTAESLAVELAKRTRFLRDEVIKIEMEEEKEGKGKLYGFYDAFKRYLIANLKEEDFADMYSQTVAYGLFAARTRSTNNFNRRLAFDLIPQTIGILRDVFQFISFGNLPKQMEVIIDDIAEVLNVADVNNILHNYYKAGKGEDPIIHFYETFLNIYDPETREKRGVYYTPEPVVRYIVRSVHELLKTHFDRQDGLASNDVTLLDPAAGTLTFPAEAIKLAVKEYADKYGEGGLNRFISNQILKNFYAFELMMAPYAIGHIKISFLLDEIGYKMKEDERFKLYLTNTLDMEDLSQTQIPGLESLSTESHSAGQVKKNEPILVIMGNPPYSGHSANKNEWTEKILKEDINGASNYYTVDGKPIGERNPKWLQDDYVKFLRFAQWKIHLAGRGIVGMITNHSYLDNPTFRGMRQSLMNTFNEIYIIDLHGNSLKKETAPDGSKDENVFDIRQGVSIAIFVKQKNKKGCKVYVNDLYGLREEKYKWLDKIKYSKKTYEHIVPFKPFYQYKKDTTKEIKHYLKWLNVQNIFPVNSVGIVTARDNFAIDFNEDNLERRISQFKNQKIDNDIIRATYNLKNSGSWDLGEARKEVAEDTQWKNKLYEILYRPFDTRHIFYSDSIVERSRRDVMQHILNGNLGLISVRQVAEGTFNHAFITNKIIESRITLSNKGIGFLFPLYIFKKTENKQEDKKPRGGSFKAMMLFEPEVSYDASQKVPNIAPNVFELLTKAYQKKPTPEQILYYCYAVLYSNIITVQLRKRT
ncbi:MAG: DNA methyltransferase, partial [Ignavibacteria bacterium RIFOXYA2_FULL_35_10]